MIKKLLILLSVFILCSCSNAYKELGYSRDTSKKIRTLNASSQAFFGEYSQYLEQLVINNYFVEENLETYLLFKDYLSPELNIELVNDGIINSNNLERVIVLASDDNFEEENLKDYLKYYLRTDESILIFLVNNNRMNDYSKVAKLAKDEFFKIDNLDLYLEYYENNDNIRDYIEYINTKRYLEAYKNDIKADVDKYGYQVLVNKYYVLDKDYEPDDLVDVESKYGVGVWREEAYKAYKKMQDDAEELGLSIYITSPYRSYNTQYNLYSYYLNIDTVENVDTYSARPGYSEHQLGLAVDILKPGYDFGDFYTTPEANWLEENAYKYGFIFRYPEDKIDITGYKYEPWHYRYVGDIAQDVYEKGITYDEYFELYVK